MNWTPREEDQSLGPEHWAKRYKLESKMENIYLKEECYWQERGRERCLTMGDANTRFFHSSANGARRKTRICSLDIDEGLATSQAAISTHIVELFFKELWQVIKKGTLDMVQDFNRGCLDLKRLNYGVITLVPKV
jgi:hypothetical protein